MIVQGALDLSDLLDGGSFALPDFPDCKMNLFTATPCTPVPKATGSVIFNESNPYFADNNLGDGAIVTIGFSIAGETESSKLVRIVWRAWNEFEYESVVW